MEACGGRDSLSIEVGVWDQSVMRGGGNMVSYSTQPSFWPLLLSESAWG